MKPRSSSSRKARAPAASRRRTRKTERPVARTPGIVGAESRNTHRRSPEIIDAAACVFAERGYHGATTQDIADLLGIRQASLYYYLPSKEVALEIVCTRGVEDFFKAAQAIAAGPGTAEEKLTSLVRAHISPLLDRGDFVKVFLTQRQFLPHKSRRRVGKWSRAIEHLFERVIREGVRKGSFSADIDARLATLAILGMANAVAGWYGKEETSIERIGGEFTKLILAGLAPRTGARRNNNRKIQYCDRIR
jgi:TetR/AcrR family transcriptional regulator, cholesterol catabolism regulator